MDTHTNKEEEHSIYTGTLPLAAEQKQEQESSGQNDQDIHGVERKKYHSSAMYAASMGRNSVGHVKAYSHRPLDL